MTTTPDLYKKYRAQTTGKGDPQKVIIEVTRIEEETEQGWYVWGYRQYKNRRNGVRSTMIPAYYFISKI